MSFVAAMALAVEILGAERRLEGFGDGDSKLLERGRVASREGRGVWSTSSGSTIWFELDGDPIEGAGEGLGTARGGGRGGGFGGFGGAGDEGAGAAMLF
jgi:hypothetical protein